MAKKKRKKKGGQLAFGLQIKDERVPKLLGVLLLFICLYLFIAFTSYLFTWQVDQDLVLRFSWELLLQSNIEMANWLGRLGAIVSNFFFYYLFGFPSYLLIVVLGIAGIAMIKQTSVQKVFPVIRNLLIAMFASSILLELFLPGAAFPIGGALGESVKEWLLKFVGMAGTIVLFLFVAMTGIVWHQNPDFRELTPQRILESIQFFFRDLVQGNLRRPEPVRRNVRREQTALRPGKRNSLSEAKARALEAEDIEGADEDVEEDGLDLDTPPRPREKVAPKKPVQTEEEQEEIRRQQLSFDLVEERKPFTKETLTTDNAELEIEKPGESAEKNPGERSAAVPAQPLIAQEENREHSEPYDPTLELAAYEHPVVSLLKDYSDQRVEIDRQELEANKDQIIETLLNYKIEITKIRATIGPTITLYEIVPAPGVRISKIKNLEDDIALSLAALGIRIIAPIPGKGTIGIEVPNNKKQTVSMREVLVSEKFKRSKYDLPIALGKTISNEVFVVDLAKMPHLLIAGATGQGKSVGINAVITSLLYKKHPSQVKLVLIDPKKVELFPYSKLEHHFLSYLPNQEEPITTETNRVIHTLNSLCIEMDNRYDLLKKASARNIREYNEKFVARRLNPLKGHQFMPFIVLIIDEFADLIMTAGKEVELPIGRLAQLARAVGIHLIIATQRPSVNIITGVIKANFPARIAYKVTSKVDSRTILDAGGADQLIGRGDMLLSIGGEMVRIQGAFIDTPEVEDVINFIAEQRGYPEPHYLPEYHGDDEIAGEQELRVADLDEMFDDAARLIVQNQHGSTSMIQRRLKLGYNRAGRIMDQLESTGIVGPNEGSKAREVLIYDEVELERFLNDLRSKR